MNTSDRSKASTEDSSKFSSMKSTDEEIKIEKTVMITTISGSDGLNDGGENVDQGCSANRQRADSEVTNPLLRQYMETDGDIYFNDASSQIVISSDQKSNTLITTNTASHPQLEKRRSWSFISKKKNPNHNKTTSTSKTESGADNRTEPRAERSGTESKKKKIDEGISVTTPNSLVERKNSSDAALGDNVSTHSSHTSRSFRRSLSKLKQGSFRLFRKFKAHKKRKPKIKHHKQYNFKFPAGYVTKEFAPFSEPEEKVWSDTVEEVLINKDEKGETLADSDLRRITASELNQLSRITRIRMVRAFAWLASDPTARINKTSDLVHDILATRKKHRTDVFFGSTSKKGEYSRFVLTLYCIAPHLYSVCVSFIFKHLF